MKTTVEKKLLLKRIEDSLKDKSCYNVKKFLKTSLFQKKKKNFRKSYRWS